MNDRGGEFIGHMLNKLADDLRVPPQVTE
jgi:hypothetical protein